MVKIDIENCKDFVPAAVFDEYMRKADYAYDVLVSGNGPGADFLGWIDLPSRTLDSDILDQCDRIVQRWSKNIDVVVVIGIGGSYLGAKSVIDALSHSFDAIMGKYSPQIIFAGHNLSEIYLAETLDFIKQKSVAVLVVSKSGTTTEPAVAFRVIKHYMEERYGKEGSRERIVAVTDAARGALKGMCEKEGYTALVIPDSVGGRYSIMTPAGLLPLALAGHDVKDFLEGARAMQRICLDKESAGAAMTYAAMRNALYSSGKKIELMVNYNPKFVSFSEWWKQLFGESEGKDGKGLFPASVTNTTDLHSMGQYIQQGERLMFETVLRIKSSNRRVEIPFDEEDNDGLNYLYGKTVGDCNLIAEQGVSLAHKDGGVPSMVIEINNVTEYNLGALYYFFEFSCALSGYILGVNPFDQPGVEMYKRNMFALLDKPGYEKERERLSRLRQ